MKQIPNPNIIDILKSNKLDIFATFNCHRIGIINSFDPTSQTASVQLVDKRTVNIIKDNGVQYYNYSVLVNCPVYIPKAAAGGYTYPISAGDNCLVLFNDRDIDNWFNDGLVQVPNSVRMHDLSDGIVIVGLYNLNNAIADYNNSATEMNYGLTKISLTDKIVIQNATQNLKTVLDSLITCLLNLQILDPISGNLSITTATVTALDNVQNNLNSLLK